jgi:hypothetical protein
VPRIRACNGCCGRAPFDEAAPVAAAMVGGSSWACPSLRDEGARAARLWCAHQGGGAPGGRIVVGPDDTDGPRTALDRALQVSVACPVMVVHPCHDGRPGWQGDTPARSRIMFPHV